MGSIDNQTNHLEESIIPEKNNFFRIIDNDKYTPVPKLNTLSINEFIEKLNLLK